MGHILSRRTKKAPQVVLMGLDGAGKSTLLARLLSGQRVETTPTVGFNVGTLVVEKGVALTIWDVGGQCGLRPHWKYYFDDCKALVYVVDGTDRDRLVEAQKALRKILIEDALKEVPVMVLVNKKDLPNSMTIREVSNQLDLAHSKDRDWQVQACSAYTGLGLQQAFLSVAKLIKHHH